MVYSEYIVVKKHLESEKILLKEQEKLFKLLIEQSLDMSAVLDKSGRYIYVSPSHKFILGYSSNELLGKKITSLIHPEDMPKLLEDEKQALQGRLATNKEFRLKHKRGKWVTVEGSAQALLDERGKPVISVVKARDITERKEFETNITFLAEASNILSSSLDYKTTLDSITKLAARRVAEWGVVDLINNEGKLETVSIWHENPNKRKAGIRFRTEFPRDISAPVGVGKAIRTGKPDIMIYKRDRKVIEQYAGNKTYIQLLDRMNITTQLSVPLKVHCRIIGGILLASSDPNKHFDSADILFAEELAHRAAVAIDNAQRYKEAQEVIASKNDFIAMASHELKTPVTSLKIHTQILRKKFARTHDEFGEQFVKMEEQLDQLTGLIDELLDLSRIQRKKLIYHKELFAMDCLVEEIVKTMQESTEVHTILLRGQTKRKIFADKNRIGQVLTNLMTNAIKYSRNAHKIIVTCGEDAESVFVTVQDFGIGISKEHQKKIFERFYQVTDSVGRTFPGLGIGLYLSSEIVKEHHGTIWVESELGKGSTFSFRLPIASKFSHPTNSL